MIADLKPYPAYRESGLPWMGKVPGHWDVVRIKTVLRESDSRSTDGTGVLLSLTRNRGLIPRRDMTDKQHSAKTLIGYKCYKSVQIVMNRMQAWSGMFGSGAICGLVSPDYAVFDILGLHVEKFILERLKTQDLVGQFALESKGIGSGFNRLYTDRFGPIPISLPPHDEQTAIMRFLNWANGQLEKAIRAKRKVITLLSEQKQAIIHRAVTRGLDPSVPIKPSGIPWLGDIPEHWEMRRLRHACEMRVSNVDKHIKLSEVSVRLCNYVEVYKHERIQEDTRFMLATATEDEKQQFRLVNGDVLITKDSEQWDDIGVPALVEYDAHDLVCGYHLAILRPRFHLLGEFLLRALQCRVIASQFYVEANGVTRYGLSHGAILGVTIPMPPLDEQKLITEWINRESNSIDTAISRFEREIELLREYRIRLVADVVTGKLDVREAAAKLLDEPDSEQADDFDIANESGVKDFEEFEIPQEGVDL